jgi:phosphatidylinositol-3-phosphatase
MLAVWFRVVMVAFGISVLLACGGSPRSNEIPSSQPPSTNPPTPTVDFSATPSTIPSGQSSVLKWATTNATSVSIQPVGPSSLGPMGSVTVSPSATTTYTITAIGPGGSASSTATVTVNSPSTSTPPPTIKFSADHSTVSAGQNVVLSWITTNAASVEVQPGGGSNLPPTGSITVTPSQTTTYVGTATGEGGRATSSVTITVTSSTPAPTIKISATPSTITSGQGATLTWSTTDATSVSIQPDGGLNFPPSGTLNVKPSSTTTYTATATGDGGTATATVAVTVNTSTGAYLFGHVVIVALENKNYSSVVGNTAAMPYLNSLISQFGLATKYYANTHPSIGNYFILTTGQIITNDDNFNGVVTADNVVREMKAVGVSWSSYAEDLPYAGYVGGNTGLYVRRHNPFTYFSDVLNDSALAKQNIIPFTQFASDLSSGNLPHYSFIVPNIDHDAHECPNGIDACESVADQWLQNNIGPLLANPDFRSDGVLIIWFDESDTDNSYGGGQVPLVLISPAWSKSGYRSNTFGQHENTLRFTMDALGVSSVPGAGASAHGWNEFFNAH